MDETELVKELAKRIAKDVSRLGKQVDLDDIKKFVKANLNDNFQGYMVEEYLNFIAESDYLKNDSK